MKGHVVIPSGAGSEYEIIHQPGHGFTAQHPIRLAGAMWIKAQADNDKNAQTMGFVAEVIDEDNFKIARDGKRIWGNWIAETEYFLNPLVAGEAIPEPEIWNIGEVRQSLGWSDEQGWLYIEIDVGDVMGLYTPRQEFPFDKDFEWCVFAGQAEIFKLDFSAGYAYTIAWIKLESDGKMMGLDVRINGQVVDGLGGITVNETPTTYAAIGNNKVVKNDVVTIHTSVNYSGTPTVLRVKLIFTI